MLPTELPAWIYALGGALPSIGVGIWQFLKWWREAETAEQAAAKAERREQEDRARAAHDAIWRQVNAELERAHGALDEERRRSAWWETQARAQHAAAWELRGVAADARQAFVGLRARVGGNEEVPPEWRRPLAVPPVESPPRLILPVEPRPPPPALPPPDEAK